MRRAAALAGLAGLAGCSLIDQRTFNPQAGMRPTFPSPAVPVAVAPEPGPRPLLTVRPPVDPAQLRADLAKAVGAARRVKPGVIFDVVELTPQSVDPGADAASVAQLIVAQGVPQSRVHLAARPITAGSPEVRVYVR